MSPFFFFWLGQPVNVDLVNVDQRLFKVHWDNLVALKGALGSPSRPKPYKSPLLAQCGLISLFLWLLTFEKFLWSDYELNESGFSASIYRFNLFCTWGQCPLFCKMLVAILLGMHASAYFIFGIFISTHFLPWFMPCHLREMHIYIYNLIIFFCFLSASCGCMKMLSAIYARDRMLSVGKETYLWSRNLGDFGNLVVVRTVRRMAWPLVNLELG